MSITTIPAPTTSTSAEYATVCPLCAGPCPSVIDPGARRGSRSRHHAGLEVCDVCAAIEGLIDHHWHTLRAVAGLGDGLVTVPAASTTSTPAVEEPDFAALEDSPDVGTSAGSEFPYAGRTVNAWAIQIGISHGESFAHADLTELSGDEVTYLADCLRERDGAVDLRGVAVSAEQLALPCLATADLSGARLVGGEQEVTVGGDGTLTATYATSRVRGGGAAGAKAYVARIVGTGGPYGLEREFCDKDRSGLSGSGASGTLVFALDGDGVYETKHFSASSSRSTGNEYWVVLGDQVTPVSKETASALCGALSERGQGQ